MVGADDTVGERHQNEHARVQGDVHGSPIARNQMGILDNDRSIENLQGELEQQSTAAIQ